MEPRKMWKHCLVTNFRYLLMAGAEILKRRGGQAPRAD
jgi:hypothetical protein